MKEKAWIYPDKGIAVFMGMGDSSIFRVSYFKKTTMKKYQQELHPLEKPIEFEEN
jgi:hypothetical protein